MRRLSRITILVCVHCLAITFAYAKADAPTGPIFSGDEVTIELEAPHTSHVLAGNGRYLALHLKAVRKIVLLDLLSGEHAREIGNMPDDILMAGSREFLVLVVPGQKLIQRWSLRTFERDKVARISTDDVIKKALMGHNAIGSGPLLLVGKRSQLIDLQTLQPMTIGGKVIGSADRHGYSVCVSADGRTFGGIVTGSGPVSYTRMRVGESSTELVKFGSTSHANRYAQPGPDGALLFLPGSTIYDGRTLKQLPTDALKGRSCRPTTDPSYFLAIRFVEENGESVSEVAICTTGDLATIHTARGFGEMAPRGNSNERRRYERQLHSGASRWIYLPAQNLFATLGIDNQHVCLRRFNLKQRMDDSGADYLWVVSTPEAVAITGKPYRYQVETLSNSDGLKFKIESGPK